MKCQYYPHHHHLQCKSMVPLRLQRLLHHACHLRCTRLIACIVKHRNLCICVYLPSLTPRSQILRSNHFIIPSESLKTKTQKKVLSLSLLPACLLQVYGACKYPDTWTQESIPQNFACERSASPKKGEMTQQEAGTCHSARCNTGRRETKHSKQENGDYR